MTYDLYLGDYSYSSWSLRAWMLFERAGLPRRLHLLDFDDPVPVAQQLASLVPARTVPTLVTPEGAIVSESLAIAEELASRHPEAGLWPANPAARATARSLASEMHAGFGPLRDHCPMNLRTAYRDVPVPEPVIADLRRLETIWDHARAVTGSDTPWLCGHYSVADAFFAPVAARIAGYDLAVADSAAAYVAAHLADPAFRRFRAMGLARGATLARYARDYATVAWPGPAPRPARAVDHGPAENAACPYSGEPVTHYLETDGRVFGFCNAFCRDKTMADPDAWPAFTALRTAA
ncbi:glutathione S-transferase N-terminal domain-containing protein [Roseovarius aestuariivivens]|uniref:glutathione S-transferase N-terminal domain-containing protein n=1 Tax=Roseovarius aestuariivivens TaxID=1888910 RepID=UPI0010801E53|nr:glutathione S-transferase N-terminal domain-containing protein [Roseovarius aestuariivivens]